jgi:hypothetical protein
MFYLINDHGDRYARAATAEQALTVLDRLIAADGRAADHFAVIELDTTGNRVGQALTRERPVPRMVLLTSGAVTAEELLAGDGRLAAAL